MVTMFGSSRISGGDKLGTLVLILTLLKAIFVYASINQDGWNLERHVWLLGAVMQMPVDNGFVIRI